MGDPRRRTWRRVAGWLVSLASFGLIAWVLQGRWNDVATAGGLPGVAPAAVAVGANVLGNGVLTQAWREIVAVAGPRLPFPVAAWVWAASQLARFSISGAQVAARAALARRYGMTGMTGGVTTVVEVAWQTSLNPLLMLATLPWWLPAASDLAWVAWVGVLPGLVLVLGIAAPDRLLRATAWALRRPPLSWLARGRLSGRLDELHLSRARAAELTLLFVLNTGLRLGAFLVIVDAVGASLTDHGLAAVGAFALGQFVGRIAVFAPGGIGPREGATALVLAPAIGSGPALVVVAATRLLEVAGEAAYLGLARVALARSGITAADPSAVHPSADPPQR